EVPEQEPLPSGGVHNRLGVVVAGSVPAKAFLAEREGDCCFHGFSKKSSRAQSQLFWIICIRLVGAPPTRWARSSAGRAVVARSRVASANGPRLANNFLAPRGRPWPAWLFPNPIIIFVFQAGLLSARFEPFHELVGQVAVDSQVTSPQP